MIEIRTQDAEKYLEKQLNGLSKNDAALALSRAINQTLGKANTRLNSVIREEYKIKIADLNKKELKDTRKASQENLTGFIGVSDRPLSLSNFNPVFTRTRIINNRSVLTKTDRKKSTKLGPKSRADEGVQIEVLYGQKSLIPGAFMNGSGNSPVLIRGMYDGKFIYGGKSILKMRTKSLYFMAINEKVLRSVNSLVRINMVDRLGHEIKQGLKYGRKYV